MAEIDPNQTFPDALVLYFYGFSMVDKFTRHHPPECFDPVEVIYLDNHVLVINKPAGLLSVPGRFVKDCVLSRMLIDYPHITIVHRLDLDTSGLLVLARSKLATSDLNRQFRQRLIHKEYIAKVFGSVEDNTGEISLAIAPDPHHRPRQIIDQENGKSALTYYEVIERTENITRLRLLPETGRSHQLRLHLASIGHPILGCDLYAHAEAFNGADRLCLHASLLGFRHPESGITRQFTAEPPF